nr:MAG TPA: hypothetical protein [Caudoviricetes sp.]
MGLRGGGCIYTGSHFYKTSKKFYKIYFFWIVIFGSFREWVNCVFI